ncbi:MAG: ABC transporter ATP-binding protein [bacterium]
MTDNCRKSVLLKLEHIKKYYYVDDVKLSVLTDVNFVLKRGSPVGLLGKSGAGKTTLLNIAATLERPDGGSVTINGQNPLEMKDKKLSKFRNSSIGIVFQFHHLLPEFTALDNVAMPLMLNTRISEAREKAASILERVGMKDRMEHKPAELSGGEQQRVSVARAISNEPKLLLLDEPTGNLDKETGQSVFELILALIKEKNIGAVFVTHNVSYTERFSETYVLEKGEVWKQ